MREQRKPHSGREPIGLLRHLEHRCIALWSAEPKASPALRTELLERLVSVGNEIERVGLRVEMDPSAPIDGDLLRRIGDDVDDIARSWHDAVAA